MIERGLFGGTKKTKIDYLVEVKKAIESSIAAIEDMFEKDKGVNKINTVTTLEIEECERIFIRLEAFRNSLAIIREKIQDLKTSNFVNSDFLYQSHKVMHRYPVEDCYLIV